MKLRLVHYARGEPFRSITALPDSQRERVLAGLTERNAWGVDRFSDPEYLSRRVAVERRLRAEFLARGGRPLLDCPIYFFLGPHPGFESHPANRRYEIEMKDVSPFAISFTYGDSLIAWDAGYRALAGAAYQDPRCGRLFGAGEIDELNCARTGLLGTQGWPGEPRGPIPVESGSTSSTGGNGPVIEAQLWVKPSDEIVNRGC